MKIKTSEVVAIACLAVSTGLMVGQPTNPKTSERVSVLSCLGMLALIKARSEQ